MAPPAPDLRRCQAPGGPLLPCPVFCLLLDWGSRDPEPALGKHSLSGAVLGRKQAGGIGGVLVLQEGRW